MSWEWTPVLLLYTGASSPALALKWTPPAHPHPRHVREEGGWRDAVGGR